MPGNAPGSALCAAGTVQLRPALREFRPKVFFAVPLILRKMVDETIGEFMNTKSGKAKLENYEQNPDFCAALRTIFMEGMGGAIEEFVTGGAAIPDKIEQLLAVKLKTPFATGYGMTECAPLISVGKPDTYKLKSVGNIRASILKSALIPLIPRMLLVNFS